MKPLHLMLSAAHTIGSLFELPRTVRGLSARLDRAAEIAGELHKRALFAESYAQEVRKEASKTAADLEEARDDRRVAQEAQRAAEASLEQREEKIREILGYEREPSSGLVAAVEALKQSELSWLARCHDAEVDAQEYMALAERALTAGLLECGRLRTDVAVLTSRAEAAEAARNDLRQELDVLHAYRMEGRTVDVMLGQCEDLEALEQGKTFMAKSREGFSLALQLGELRRRAEGGDIRARVAETAEVEAIARAKKAEARVAELETELRNLEHDLRGVDIHTIQTIRTNIGALSGEPVTVAAGRVVTDLAGWKARAIVAESRVTELETALNNAANGIGFGDAGPVVYALNARHDEQAAEWESEREELVRTRQETQDKLSEARRELTELRANLRGCERWGTDISNALALYGVSQYDKNGTFVGTGTQLVDGVKGVVRQRDELRARAEKAERLHAEEKDAFLRVADAVGLVHEQSMGPRFAGPAEDVVAEVRGFVAENARLTAELKALKAPVAGEPNQAGMLNAWDAFDGCGPEGFARFALQQWRAGHAAGVSASQPTAERATDEELLKVFLEAGDLVAPVRETLRLGVEKAAARLAGIRAVAAHVRKERCLVTRAMEMDVDLYVAGAGGDFWEVHVLDAGVGAKPDVRKAVTADVPATLSAMLDSCDRVVADPTPTQDENVSPAVEELGQLLAEEKSE